MNYYETLGSTVDYVDNAVAGGGCSAIKATFEYQRDRLFIKLLRDRVLDDAAMPNSAVANTLYWLDTFAEYDDGDKEAESLAAMSLQAQDDIVECVDIQACDELTRYENMWR